MKLIHALILMFFVLIALYLGLGPTGNHGASVATVFNAGGPQVVSTVKALQGR